MTVSKPRVEWMRADSLRTLFLPRRSIALAPLWRQLLDRGFHRVLRTTTVAAAWELQTVGIARTLVGIQEAIQALPKAVKRLNRRNTLQTRQVARRTIASKYGAC